METFKILNEGIYVPSLSLVSCWVLLWEDTEGEEEAVLSGALRSHCSQAARSLVWAQNSVTSLPSSFSN